jgi:hypothetical protein
MSGRVRDVGLGHSIKLPRPAGYRPAGLEPPGATVKKALGSTR